MAEQLGHMYRVVKQHEKAANMFRFMLKMAWVLGDANMELKAYQHLGNEHFSMGNLEKSKYYLVRHTRGLLESDQSRMKTSIVQPYKDRLHKHKKKIKINLKIMKNTADSDILPSPSNDRHQCDKNKSMFVFPGIYYSK